MSDPMDNDDLPPGTFVFPVPPEESWFARLPSKVKAGISTAEFAAALACAGVAWSVGGDMTLTVIALIAGWAFASIGMATIPSKSGAWKFLAIIGLLLLFSGVGGFLYWHFHMPLVEYKNDNAIPNNPPTPSAQAKNDNTTLIEPPIALRHNSDGSERIFVQVTPSDLMAEFKTHTEEHAKEIVRRYLGKWMALKGTIYDISTNNRGDIKVDIGGTDALSALMNGVHQLHFDVRSQDKLSVQKRGNIISAVCRIDDITGIGIALALCEIVETH
jgi:hypothetical protein